MQKKEKPKRQIRISKADPVMLVGIYLNPETHKRIKAKAEAKFVSMSGVIRQTVEKIIKPRGRI
jgi:predicted transcriptional regulator